MVDDLAPITVDGDTSYVESAFPGRWDGDVTPPRSWGSYFAPSETAKEIGGIAAETGITAEGMKGVGRGIAEDVGAAGQAIVEPPPYIRDYFRKGMYGSETSRREASLADSTTQYIDAVKGATNVELENPAYGGYSEEASKNVFAKIKSGALPPLAGVPYSDEVLKEQYNLFQRARDQLATRFVGNSQALGVINSAEPLEQYADALVRETGQTAERDYAKAKGNFFPWIASTVAEQVGMLRNPANVAYLLATPGETVAKSGVRAVAEEAARLGLISGGITAAQEPEIQARQAQLGEETGFVPALKDIAGSTLGGMVMGGVIRGIREAGRIWRGASATDRQTKIEELLDATRRTPPEGVTPEQWADWNTDFFTRKWQADAAAWERQKADAAKKWDDLNVRLEPETPQPPTAPGVIPPTNFRRAANGRPIINGKFASEEAFRAAQEAHQAIIDAQRPPMTPGSEDLPRTTVITPEAVDMAEMDHEATASAAHPDIIPGDTLAGVQGAMRHAEDPDNVPPPRPAPFTPDAPASPIAPDASGVAVPKLAAHAETIDGKPVSHTSFDPLALKVDPATFQYKTEGIGPEGVSKLLKGTEQWAPMATGNIVVWERADGTQFVADGHQRTGLARRLDAQGRLPDETRLQGYLLKESDGWTPADARAVAAKKNIQEGSGSPIDIARVLRDRPDLWDKSLPASELKMKQAYGLARLSPEAWGMTVNGAVKPNYASLVGAGVADSEAHVSVLDDMIKMRPQDENAAQMIVAEANMAGFRRAVQQGDLLGDETLVTRSLLPQRISVYSAVVKALKTDAKLFGMLDQHAAAIEEAGNELVDTNADRAERSEQLAGILMKLSNYEGPVRAALNKAAQRVAEAGDEKQQRAATGREARAFLREIDGLIEKEGLKLSSLARRTDIDTETPQGRAQQTEELIRAAEERRQPPPPAVRPNRIALSTGAKLWSASGREMSPIPKINTIEGRMTKATLGRVDAWLVREATEEFQDQYGKDYIKELISSVDPKRITPADRTTLNLILFGDAEGATEANLTKSTAANINLPPTPAQAAIAAHPLVREAEARLAAQAAPPAPSLPRVTVGKPGGYADHNAQIWRDLSDRMGLTAEIERLFAEGKTAGEVRRAIEPQIANIDAGDRTGFVTSVRATLGIPSQIAEEGKSEFAAWKAARDARLAAQAAPPPHPGEAEVRQLVDNAHAALQASGTPLDQAVDRLVTEQVEPLVEAAFPKPPLEFGGRTIDERTSILSVDRIRAHTLAEIDHRIKMLADEGALLARAQEVGETPEAFRELVTENLKNNQEILRRLDELLAHPSAAARRVEELARAAKIKFTDMTEPIEAILLPEEPTAAGPQTLIPGVEPVTQAERLAAEAARPLRGGEAPPPAGGLFDEGARRQMDMLDRIIPENATEAIPREDYLKRSTPAEALSKFIRDCED